MINGKINGEKIILKNELKYEIKTFKFNRYEYNEWKQNKKYFWTVWEKVGGKCPCLIYKTNILNVGFT